MTSKGKERAKSAKNPENSARPSRKRLTPRNALKDITNLSNDQGMSHKEMQTVVQNNQVSMMSYRTWQQQQMSFNSFLKCMVYLKVQRNKEAIPTAEEDHKKWLSQNMEQMKNDLHSMSFDDDKLWVTVLHSYAMLRQGRMDNDDIASTNVYGNLDVEGLRTKPEVAIGSSSITPSEFQDEHESIDADPTSSDEDSGEDDEEDFTVAEPQLEEQQLRLVQSLAPIRTNVPRMSINTLIKYFGAIKTELKRTYGKTVSYATSVTVTKILKYNAIHYQWYSFGGINKYWMTEDDVSHILSVLWNCIPTGPWFHPVLKILSAHTVIQCLDVMGIRLASLLDTPVRPHGQIGRYLRWSMIKITLTGYDNNNEPIFMVAGSVTGAKGASEYGDFKFKDFAVGTRSDGDPYATDRDLALGFVALAVAQRSMGELLQKAIFDRSFGEGLISRSANGQYCFSLAPGFDFAPIFISNSINSKIHHKHKLDEIPGLPQFSPMNNATLSRYIKEAGIIAGFQQKVSYRHFRLSYSYKATALPAAKGWEVTNAMCHTSENEALTQMVYQPTRHPCNIAEAKFGLNAGAIQSERALSRIGALEHRPNPEALGSGLVNDLLLKLQEHEDGKLTDEALIELFATVNGGKQVSIDKTKLGISRLPSDNWAEAVRTPHPFVSKCANKTTKVISYIVNQGPYACPSCNTFDHFPNHKSGISYFNNVSECYEKQYPRRCLCGVCKEPVDVSQCKAHFMQCFNNWKAALSVDDEGLLKYDTICQVQVESKNYWQQAIHLVCPFECCLDFDMLEHNYPADKMHLKQINIGKKSPRTDLNAGKTRMTFYDSPGTLSKHMTTHVFNPCVKNQEFSMRFITPKKEEKLMCGIYLCAKKFEDSTVGVKERLMHLVNDHQLPLIMNRNAKFAKTITAENFDIFRLAPLKYCRQNAEFNASRTDNDKYFQWKAPIRDETWSSKRKRNL